MKNVFIQRNFLAAIHLILEIPVQLKMVWFMHIIPLESDSQVFCLKTFNGISIERPLCRVSLTI